MKTPQVNLEPVRAALAAAQQQKELQKKFLESIAPAVLEALAPIMTKMADATRLTKEELILAVSHLNIHIPPIEVPKAEVIVKIPEIKVPTPEVKVTIPEIKIPEIKVPTPEVNVEVPPLDFTPLIAGFLSAVKLLIPKEQDDTALLSAITDLGPKLSELVTEMKKEKPFKLDKMQLAELTVGRSGGGYSGPTTNGLVYDGRKVVSVTNTPVRLKTDQLCEEVFITALTTNSDVVTIGGPGVIFTEAARTGRSMNPGDSIVLKIHNLKDVWVNGTANDGVAFTYTA